MTQTEIAARLILIEEALARVELMLASHVPPAEVRRAIDDVLATYGLLAQMKEVHAKQRDQLTILIGLATQLISETKEGDQEIRDLLVQLRELGRKHVRGLADLEKAQDWHETEAARRLAEWKPGDPDPPPHRHDRDAA